jgi:hypothetical protein
MDVQERDVSYRNFPSFPTGIPPKITDTLTGSSSWATSYNDPLRDFISVCETNSISEPSTIKSWTSTSRKPAQDPKPRLQCNFLECARKSKSFGRPAELRRHTKTFHSDEDDVAWCPAPFCTRDDPFPTARRDKLVEHIRNMHRSAEERRQWYAWSQQLGTSIIGGR